MANSTASASGVGTSLPSGSVIPFAGDNIPVGWLLCDGSIVSRSGYRDLFNAIGEAWGNGDGSSTFHIPDMRGMTLRGVDDPAGSLETPPNRDPDKASRTAMNAGGNTGDNVGSYQSHAMEQHVHEVYQSGNFGGGTNANSEHHLSGSWNTRHQGGAVGVSTSTETRMKNCSVNYIVKV